MEAIVLAGGLGTRLRNVISEIPKVMAPINGRPFLRFLLDDIISKGVERIILSVGYKKEVIRSYFGESYRGIEIIYSSEETPLLTGGAIKKALSYCNEENVFVFNGDSFFDINIRNMMIFMKEKNAELVIAGVKLNNFDRYGTLKLSSDGKILKFIEKKHTLEGIINGGIYLVKKNFLINNQKNIFSFERELLEPLVTKEKFYAYLENSFFIDIGIPEDYKKAKEIFYNKLVKNRFAFFFLDKTFFNNKKKSQKELIEYISKYDACGFKIIVITDSEQISSCYITKQNWNKDLARFKAHIDVFYHCFGSDSFDTAKLEKYFERILWEFDVIKEESVLLGDNPLFIKIANQYGLAGIQI